MTTPLTESRIENWPIAKLVPYERNRVRTIPR